MRGIGTSCALPPAVHFSKKACARSSSLAGCVGCSQNCIVGLQGCRKATAVRQILSLSSSVEKKHETHNTHNTTQNTKKQVLPAVPKVQISRCGLYVIWSFFGILCGDFLMFSVFWHLSRRVKKSRNHSDPRFLLKKEISETIQTQGFFKNEKF